MTGRACSWTGWPGRRWRTWWRRWRAGGPTPGCCGWRTGRRATRCTSPSWSPRWPAAAALTVTEAGAAELAGDSAPGSLSAAIADRLGFVTGPVREVLRAAALLGVDFTVTDLAIVLGRSVADLVRAIDEACAVGRADRVASAAGVPAPADQGRAVRRDAGAGPGRLAPRRRPRPGRGRRPGRPGRPAAAAGRRRAARSRPGRWTSGCSTGSPAPRTRWSTRHRESPPSSSPGPWPARRPARSGTAGCPAGSPTPTTGWATPTAAEQVASLALEYATEPDVVEALHWTLAQCRMLAGPGAEPLAALDRALAAPGISARHRARLMVLAARTHLHLGEVEEAGRVAGSALEAATEAADNWAMAWALHVLTIMTGVQGHPADTLPLFDRALAVTQADAGLSDLRLLLQINQAVTLAQPRPVRRGAGRGRPGPAAGRPGRHGPAADPGAQRPRPAAVRDRAVGRRAGRGGGHGRGPQGTRRRLLRPRHRRRHLLPPRRDRRGPAAPGRGRPVRRADRPPAHRHAGPGPQPGPRVRGRAARSPGRADRRIRQQHRGAQGDRGPAGRRRPPRRRHRRPDHRAGPGRPRRYPRGQLGGPAPAGERALLPGPAGP